VYENFCEERGMPVRQSCFQGDVISKGDCIALCQCALLGQDAKIDVSIKH
jgi:hypothetical protein